MKARKVMLFETFYNIFRPIAVREKVYPAKVRPSNGYWETFGWCPESTNWAGVFQVTSLVGEWETSLKKLKRMSIYFSLCI